MTYDRLAAALARLEAQVHAQRNARQRPAVLDHLDALTPGQMRVVEALLGDSQGRTYRQIAALLGVHLGTVYTHLKRVRDRHPDLWIEIQAARTKQLALRHQRALARARRHTDAWFRKQRRRQRMRDGWW